jgi:hypothetical protein
MSESRLIRGTGLISAKTSGHAFQHQRLQQEKFTLHGALSGAKAKGQDSS